LATCGVSQAGSNASTGQLWCPDETEKGGLWPRNGGADDDTQDFRAKALKAGKKTGLCTSSAVPSSGDQWPPLSDTAACPSRTGVHNAWREQSVGDDQTVRPADPEHAGIELEWQ